MSWPSVIVLVAVEQRPALVERIRALGQLVPEPATGDEKLYWHGHSYRLDLSGRILADYEPDELEQVKASIGEPHAVHASCQSMDAARTLLREVLPGVDGLVDTDHFEILPARGFLALMERHPEWDWRRRPSTDLQ